MKTQNIVLGVDIGGSHITSALIDISSGQLIETSLFRSKVDSQGSANGILEQWCQVMANSLTAAENAGHIGIAMPGPFDYAKGISQMLGMGKFDSLYGLDVGELILSGLGLLARTTVFVNDASCFLQGELSHGPASAYRKVLGITLGTGFGSAIGIGGVAHDAAFWQYGFMGTTCEELFSSKWLVSRYNSLTSHPVHNVKQLIEAATHSGTLLQVFDEFAHNLGIFLAKMHREQELDCVVIGGNIAKAWPL
ncbi:MAG: ROK family protein, partial [Chitinophagaceae bacterium]